MSSMTLAQRLRYAATSNDLPAWAVGDDLLEAADLLEQYGHAAEPDYASLPPLSEVITNITPPRNPFMEMLNNAAVHLDTSR